MRLILKSNIRFVCALLAAFFILYAPPADAQSIDEITQFCNLRLKQVAKFGINVGKAVNKSGDEESAIHGSSHMVCAMDGDYRVKYLLKPERLFIQPKGAFFDEPGLCVNITYGTKKEVDGMFSC
jgi:hypothetical protein